MATIILNLSLIATGWTELTAPEENASGTSIAVYRDGLGTRLLRTRT